MESEKIRFSIRFTPEEYSKLKEYMSMAGFGTMNAYIRKMALNGYIINLDLEAILEPVKLMRNIASNINQISTRVNSTDNIYAEDVAELREKYGQLAKSVSEIVSYISRLEE